MSAVRAEGVAPQASGALSATASWGIVAALLAAYIFSFIDRMIIGLLVEPMKADLQISDTEISLLQGLAFAIFYTVAGLPLGRLIDRTRRLRLVAAGIALWSLATAACGLVAGYAQLFVFRMLVGVGEATLSPAAYSVIADSFEKRRLGLAMGVYALGSAMGAGLAFLIGAAVVALVAEAGMVRLPLVGEIAAWQATFLIVGLPGLLLALLFLVLPEPPRRESATGETRPPVTAVIAFVRANAAAVLGLCVAVGFVNLAAFAAVSWLPAFFVRVHGLSLPEAGALAGGALLVAGAIGMIGGGALTDRFTDASPQARIRACAFAGFAGVAGAALFPLAPGPVAAAAGFIVFFSAAALPVGAAATALQQMTPNRMRATVSAFYLFVVNILGLAFGPTSTAVVSDTFFSAPDGIRYAMAWVASVSFAIAVACFFLSAAGVRSRPADEAVD